VTQAQQPTPAGRKPNILFIMGDDIGWFNVSAYNMGVMGYRTPNIDRIGKEGAVFTDWYGQQSCTAGRAAFITGQSPIRAGLTKVGLPGAELCKAWHVPRQTGRPRDQPSIAPSAFLGFRGGLAVRALAGPSRPGRRTTRVRPEHDRRNGCNAPFGRIVWELEQ
jgi:hypothetical protein